MTARITKEVFDARVALRGFRSGDDYVNMSTKCTMHCAEGHIWSAKPNDVDQGRGCPHCSGHAPVSRAMFNERVASRGIYAGDDYVNTATKCTIHCSEGHEWKAEPKAVMYGSGCPHCSGNLPITKETFNESVADRGIYAGDDYVNGSIKCTIHCSEGHEWKTVPSTVRHGTGCPHCSGHAPVSRETFNERVAHRGIHAGDDFVNLKSKCTLHCSEGHEWKTTPSGVMHGNGCPHCSGKAPVSREMFDERVAHRGIHAGDDYTNTHAKCTMYCDHGHSWSVTPGSVIQGRGCPHCSGQAPVSREMFNERVAHRGIHAGNDFVNLKTKCTLHCSEGHQWFTAPSGVSSGNGCPHCSGRVPVSREMFNERVAHRGIHAGDDYKNTYTKCTLHCSEGHEWQTTPNSINNGSGCPACAGLAPLNNEIIDERIAHKPIQRLSHYVRSGGHMLWGCLVEGCGHQWEATPAHVTRDRGCPACADHGFDNTKPAILYYLRVWDARYEMNVYKIGITNRTVEERFAGEMHKITVIKIVHGTGAKVYKGEQEILAKYRKYRYGWKGYGLLSNGGNTELFAHDILNLDTEIAA